MIFFLDSASLGDYIKKNEVYTWHGDQGIGNLTFIDSPSLHVVFSSRSEYDRWDAAGRPVCYQFSLF